MRSSRRVWVRGLFLSALVLVAAGVPGRNPAPSVTLRPLWFTTDAKPLQGVQ